MHESVHYGESEMNEQTIPTYFTEKHAVCMPLRDYFAAKAMQAILSSPKCPMNWTDERLAKQSYMTADAMLKRRSM